MRSLLATLAVGGVLWWTVRYYGQRPDPWVVAMTRLMRATQEAAAAIDGFRHVLTTMRFDDVTDSDGRTWDA